MTSYKAAAAVSGLVLTVMTGGALAADVGKTDLPAVSGPNGKIEISAGYGDLENLDGDFAIIGGASLSLPLGEDFGLQADLAAVNVFDDTMVGGTLHLFTRDPESYLFGVAGGAAFSDDADVLYVGPEAELYLSNVSFELWGGYIDVDGVAETNNWFGFADLAFYPMDDLRISLGARSVAGFESAQASMEWQLGESGLPLSLTGDVRMGEDDFLTATVGVKFYFGGEDKSLIRRHREDDPRNRSLDLFNSAGSAFGSGVATEEEEPDFGKCPLGEVDVDPGPGVECMPDETEEPA
jgi:hypothetical protein